MSGHDLNLIDLTSHARQLAGDGVSHADGDVTTVIPTYLTIEVGAADGVVIGIEADLIAWAQDAWATWHKHMATLQDDGRLLGSVDGVYIARKPLSRNVVLVTLELTYIRGGSASGIGESEAKRQFWALVCGAWGTLRRSARDAASARAAV